MESVIKLEHVTKRFKNMIVLKDVSVEFEKGKIHGIIGRNGSGKTVMFKAVCGFLPVNEGEIWIRNKKIGKEIDIPSDVGIILDSSGFLPHYSGMKNLIFLAALNKKIGKDQMRKAMLQVGLDPDSKKHVSKYSMGMSQRLSIAQAIMEDQDIIILDEPMNGLDKQGVEEMRQVFLNLKKEGKTIVLASHNTQDIEILCDYVYEMDAGILTRIL